MDRIYLDYSATTPVDRQVVAAMQPYFDIEYGNPASIHYHGQRAEAAVEQARETVAQVLHCLPEEIIFTSCGSESDNLALRGAALAARESRDANTLLTSRCEHPAVSRTAEQLQSKHDFQLEWLPVDGHGMVTVEAVAEVLTPGIACLSLMYANNEIGTINPIPGIAALGPANQTSIHTDAVQAAAYLDLDVRQLKVDLLSLGAHKFYGPKGVGVLYVRKGTDLVPQQTGGGQEAGLRAGTLNVPYIVGLAKALALTEQNREERISHVLPLRNEIIARVLEEIPDARLTGHPTQRLAGHASFVFKDADGNRLVQLLDAAGFACSSGSACKTGNPKPSEVLLAVGLTPDWALGSLRVTIGTPTSPADVSSFLTVLPGLVEKARRKS